ncbi:MAG: PA14 domain-containing protein, partial [Planctomycetota bacterium]
MAAEMGLVGEYFDEIDLTSLADTRIDTTINFEQDWGDAPPGTNVTPDDNYSSRWTGFVRIERPGDWTFWTTSNDGVRLWINNNQIIENWNQHRVTEDSATVSLDAGWYPIRLEHFQQGGTAEITLSFSGPGQSKAIIPSTHLITEDPESGNPTANAGADQTVFLPDNSTTLLGSGSDDGEIDSYEWSQIDGPSTATLTGIDTPSLAVSDLQQGTYQFELVVTDDEGNTDSDVVAVRVVAVNEGGVVSGELKKWHKVTVTFDGPETSETASSNPFMNYRLDVTFTHSESGKTYVVPGYFAADGDAANTSASSGNKWRVHFAPSET